MTSAVLMLALTAVGPVGPVPRQGDARRPGPGQDPARPRSGPGQGDARPDQAPTKILPAPQAPTKILPGPQSPRPRSCRPPRPRPRSCRPPVAPAKVMPAPQAPAKILPAPQAPAKIMPTPPCPGQDPAGPPGPGQGDAGHGRPGSRQDPAGPPGPGQVRSGRRPDGRPGQGCSPVLLINRTNGGGGIGLARLLPESRSERHERRDPFETGRVASAARCIRGRQIDGPDRALFRALPSTSFDHLEGARRQRAGQRDQAVTSWPALGG